MFMVCGEALIDLVPGGEADTWRAIPGGGPANTAIALARLGAPAALLCRLSTDAFGRQLRAHLSGHGVDLEYAVEAGEPTTLAVVALDTAGSAEYAFYLNGTADWQWDTAELPSTPPLQAIHVGSLAAVMPPGDARLRAWTAQRRQSTVVCYDVNVRPAVNPDRAALTATVEQWLDLAHVVKVSDEDLAWLLPGEDPHEAIGRWTARHGLDLVLLTLGGRGAMAFAPGWAEPVRVPGVGVEVVDTVGAGDTFGAAALARLGDHGLLRSPEQLAGLDTGQARDVLGFAAAAAALACTAPGAQPPTRAEVESLSGTR